MPSKQMIFLAIAAIAVIFFASLHVGHAPKNLAAYQTSATSHTTHDAPVMNPEDFAGLMIILFAALIYFGSVALVANYASSKGHSRMAWFLWAIVLSPLLALFIVFLLPTKAGEGNQAEFRKCPFCAETVRAEAKICKHCHGDLARITS